MDTPTMADPVDDGESWKLGDIIKDNNGKEWKLVKLGSGVTRSHKDADGNLLYDDIGGDMIVLQFAEPSKKVKKGRKWEVIEGAREQVIINIMDDRFVNLSDEVRRRIDLRKADESLMSTEIDPSVRESFVADRSTIASSIGTCDSNHFDNDDNSFNTDWIAEATSPVQYVQYVFCMVTCRTCRISWQVRQVTFFNRRKVGNLPSPSCRGGKQP
jgi:hypothetical protein